MAIERAGVGDFDATGRPGRLLTIVAIGEDVAALDRAPWWVAKSGSAAPIPDVRRSLLGAFVNVRG